MKILERKKKGDKFLLTMQFGWWEPVVLSLVIAFWLMLQSFITLMNQMDESIAFPSTMPDWCAISGFSIFALAFLIVAIVGHKSLPATKPAT